MNYQQEEHAAEFQMNLNDIYMKISISENDEFDSKEEQKILLSAFETKFTDEFLMVDSSLLIKDTNKVNVTFIEYIKFCKDKHNYKRCGRMFIVYCDYFDLDYHKVYTLLHEKLQELIKKDLIKMLGGPKNYNEIKRRFIPDDGGVVSLFDLL